MCRGDEPAEAKPLVEFARDLAFEVVCAGKGKNNPLNPSATPAARAEEATSKHMNPKMLCSFVDGSKAMIEMAVAGQRRRPQGQQARHVRAAVDRRQALPRPSGPQPKAGCSPGSGSSTTAPATSRRASSPSSGPRTPSWHEEMSYLKMGPGPYFTLYRPYHLASIEAPLSVGEAVLYHQASIAPIAWNAEVGAAAKRDLRPGDALDGIGGSTVHGMIESADVFAQQRLLPLGLVGGARITRPVAKGALLTYDDVEWDRPSIIRQLRELQDRQLAENWTDAQTADEVAKAIPA